MKNTPNPINVKSFTCTYYKSNTIVASLCERHLTYNGGGKKTPFFFLLIKIVHTSFSHTALCFARTVKSTPKKPGTMAQLVHKGQFPYAFLIPG